MTSPALTRRRLGQAAGAILVAFTLDARAGFAADAPAKLPGSLNSNRMLDAWLRIDRTGTTIFTGKVELGQGALTALAQIAAEELDLPVDRLVMVAGDTALTPDEGHTSGSFTVEMSGSALRYACAEARGILIGRAAALWKAAPDKLATADGMVTGPDGKRAAYGRLAEPGLFHREATAATPPKPAAQHKIVGTSVPRFDIPRKVTGGVAYVQDIRLPGMLHGRILRPPAYRATLASFDAAAVKSLPGVAAVVRDGNFLGVVAEREEQAIAAREGLRKAAQWKNPDDLPAGDLAHWIKNASDKSTVISRKSGADAPPARSLEAAYSRAITAHASIGPSCALAQWQGDKLRVWTHTQGVFPLRRDLAKALKLPVEAIRCTHAEGSGCYGHNGADDVALDAALLARAAGGRPVRVQWMRDDEFAWEPYGSAMAMSARGSLDTQGNIIDWQYEVWSNTHAMRPGAKTGTNLIAAWHMAEPQAPSPPFDIPMPSGGGDRNAVPTYDFSSQRITNHFIAEMPLRVSSLRTLGGYANVFAVESFMDELALAAHADPVEFRLRHLKDPRARAVIEAAAKAAGWEKGAPGSDGKGRGIGFARYKTLATYVACVATVEVERATGKIAVRRVVAAVDSGQIVNPDGLKNQIEGGIVQSTSWTLHEAVGFDAAEITSRDWSGYPILTFPEVPEVEVVLLDHPDEPSLGAGEASQGPACAAIANAVAHATGTRFRDLPLRAKKVKALLGPA